jgi:hypothetical protein
VSLLWPDRLGVALYPERLVLARTRGRLRRQLVHKEIVDLAPAEPGMQSWRPAVDALAAKVAAGAMARAHVTLVLSNQFVHYTLVPRSDSLRGPDEEAAFARHCFARVHGAETDSWSIKVDAATSRDTRVACAIDQALTEALAGCMRPLGRRYRSLQPHLMASFNRWRLQIGRRELWLVVAEPGLLCLARLQDGCWHSVRTLKVGADWLQQLPGMLSREECLVDCETNCDEVLLFAPDASHPLHLDAGRWHIGNLLPALLPGMATDVDAPFAIALGA